MTRHIRRNGRGMDFDVLPTNWTIEDLSFLVAQFRGVILEVLLQNQLFLTPTTATIDPQLNPRGSG
jgi:hypothetical protein